jgi:hypothetical protein
MRRDPFHARLNHLADESEQLRQQSELLAAALRLLREEFEERYGLWRGEERRTPGK